MLGTRKIFGNIAQRCDEIVPSSDSIAIESDKGLYRGTLFSTGENYAFNTYQWVHAPRNSIFKG